MTKRRVYREKWFKMNLHVGVMLLSDREYAGRLTTTPFSLLHFSTHEFPDCAHSVGRSRILGVSYHPLFFPSFFTYSFPACPFFRQITVLGYFQSSIRPPWINDSFLLVCLRFHTCNIQVRAAIPLRSNVCASKESFLVWHNLNLPRRF